MIENPSMVLPPDAHNGHEHSRWDGRGVGLFEPLWPSLPLEGRSGHCHRETWAGWDKGILTHCSASRFTCNCYVWATFSSSDASSGVSACGVVWRAVRERRSDQRRSRRSEWVLERGSKWEPARLR